MSKKIIYFIAEDYGVLTHRLNLLLYAKNSGYNVCVMTRNNGYINKIKEHGIDVYELKHFDRMSLNPIKAIKSIREIYSIIKKVKPDVVQNVAQKPIVLGSMVALYLNTKRIVNALGGLGYIYTTGNLNLKRFILRRIVNRLMKYISSKKQVEFILQNQDDIDTLNKYQILNSKRTHLIPGSGVDLNFYKPRGFDQTIFVKTLNLSFISRMLKDKGINELIDAAYKIKNKNLPVTINLYGSVDKFNPTAITSEKLFYLSNQGVINYHGHVDDVRDPIHYSDIIILPSYREGFPKILLEALACGKPVITTNVPGCRDVVVNRYNGLLIDSHSSNAIVTAIEELCSDRILLKTLSLNAHKSIEKYSDKIINDKIVSTY